MNVESTIHLDYDDIVDAPVYRVHFWHLRPGWGANLDARILTGAADVQEAIDWAEANRGDHPWELFALVDVPRALGEEPERWWIRLHGESPVEPRNEDPAEGYALSFERLDPA